MRAPTLNRPLRLLVIPDKYLPDQCGGGAIYTDMCRGLAERGLDVTVRCPYPFYPEWTDKSGHNGWRVERYTDRGVKVERFGMFIPRNPRSVLQRMTLDLTFFASLCRSLLGGGHFDAVIAFCPHSGGVAFAALHKLLFGGPLCLSIMDLPADAATASGMARGGLLPRVFHRVQKALFNRADVWRSISPVMIERLQSLRERNQPILFIPDWLHPSIAEELQRLPSKIGRPPAQPVRLLYSGTIGAKQGLLDFCKKLQAFAVPYRFQIHAEGGGAADVREWVAGCGDPRFSFGPLLEESGFANSMHEADLYVITEKPENRAAFFPSKTIPAMASATPILAVSSPDSPLGREVRGEGLGPWFSWDEGPAMAELLSTLPRRPEEFLTWQANAVRRSQYFASERCLDLIESVLLELVEDQTPGLVTLQECLGALGEFDFADHREQPGPSDAFFTYFLSSASPLPPRHAMRILVTGGAGYVGSTLVPMLLDQGHRVRVLDTLRFGGHGLLPCCQNRFFELIKGDVCDEADVTKALAGVEAVIHLAAIVGYPACKKEPHVAQTTNVEGTRTLLRVRHPDQKVIFASTGSVYGSVPENVCTENTPRAPITIYGETKAVAEQIVLDAGNSVAYRFATAFGVSNRMRLDLMPNDFAYQAVKNRNLIVYEGGFKRTFVHVRDMARSFIFALDTWGRIKDDVYNVGHECMNFTKEQVARKILEHVDFYLHFAEVGHDADQRNYEVSYEKIRKKGFETTVDLDRGIAELVRAAHLIEFQNPFANV